jgi:hypothetical protein
MAAADDIVLEAARTIRQYLPGLLGDDAPACDAELAALLAHADAETAGDEILAVFERHPAAHAWTAAFIESRTRTSRGFDFLPGHGELLDDDIFDCPRGDYTWYRRWIGQPQERCRSHPTLELVPRARP